MAVVNDVAPQQIRVNNPVTGEEIGVLPVVDAEEVAAVVRRARAAQPQWEALGVRERCRLLRAWADRVWADRATLMQIIRRETGKNDSGAFAEIAVIDLITTYYVNSAPRILHAQTRKALFPIIQRARVYFHPHGVVGFITPWNYPYLNGWQDLIPALLAGNSVVVKPSEITPYTSAYCVEKMVEVGIPRDVIQVINGAGETGRALLEEVDCISFTGSTAVGRKIATRAAERLIPFTLELGGKDPLIVLDDADLEAAVYGVLRASLENAGQACISVERIYVEAGIYDAFIARALEVVQQVTLGSGDGYDLCMGCLTNMRELIRTEEHIRDAVEKGAKVLYGGNRRPDLVPCSSSRRSSLMSITL